MLDGGRSKSGYDGNQDVLATLMIGSIFMLATMEIDVIEEIEDR